MKIIFAFHRCTKALVTTSRVQFSRCEWNEQSEQDDGRGGSGGWGWSIKFIECQQNTTRFDIVVYIANIGIVLFHLSSEIALPVPVTVCVTQTIFLILKHTINTCIPSIPGTAVRRKKYIIYALEWFVLALFLEIRYCTENYTMEKLLNWVLK